MSEGAVKWVELRAASGASREALLRCALDLLASHGAAARRATPFEMVEQGGAGYGLCIAEVGGADVDGAGLDGAIARVREALEGRVAIAPAEEPSGAGGVAELLAGFTTEAIDHTADEAFAVVARDRADLLAAAAEALGALIVRPAGVRAERALAASVRAAEPGWPDDDRLFAWLAEVLYLLDKERFALRRAVVFEDDEEGVRGALFGEPIDQAKHEVGGGIKAVTYHGMEIAPAPGGLRAQVIIDV